MVDIWDRRVAVSRDQVFMLFEGTTWKYGDIEHLSNRIACWQHSQGVVRGQVISLMMHNCPQYVAVWLGAMKCGAVTALLNTSQKGEQQMHCIDISGSRIILCSTGYEEVLLDVLRTKSDTEYFLVSLIDGSPNQVRESNEQLTRLCQATDLETRFETESKLSKHLNQPVNASEEVTNITQISLDKVFAEDTLAALDIAKTSANPVASMLQHSKYYKEQIPKSWRGESSFNDVGLLIYTSGTTGMPKAASLRHTRIFVSGYQFIHRYDLRKEDRVLTPLPLYHSAGGVVTVISAIQQGFSVVVQRKFSVSTFWEQCYMTDATVVQYIGELCRYQLNSPESEFEKTHKVRLAFGNGLRAEVWKEFVTRFRVPEIGEFYASTEGNAGLFHHWKACSCLTEQWEKGSEIQDIIPCEHDYKIGAVGHMGSVVRWLSGMRVQQYDTIHEDVIRDKDTNQCVECAPNEAGEMVSKVVTWDPSRSFQGYYKNKASSKSKLQESVFKPGDQYFRTGDQQRQDEEGYWFFVDRVGDTFRWKGENVSTHEVEQVLGKIPGVVDACVYGIEIPKSDGRACMVALTTTEEFNWDSFYTATVESQPPYSVPLFVRQQSSTAVTGTFKFQKGVLKQEAAKDSADPVYIKASQVQPGTKGYIPFTEDAWVQLEQGKARL